MAYWGPIRQAIPYKLYVSWLVSTATDEPRASNMNSTSGLEGLTIVAPTLRAIGGKGQALTTYL